MVRGLGERLVELRTIFNMSQVDVGLKLGISNHLVSKYETGVHQPPIDIIIKLAELYKTTTDYLLGIQPHKTIVIPENLSAHRKQLIKEMIELMKSYLE